MGLVYNIYLEVAGCFFLAVLLIYSVLTVKEKNRSNHEFKVLVLALFINEVLDVATAITISYGAVVPPTVNLFLNTAYFLCNALGCYQATVYVESYVVKTRRKSRLAKLNFAACAGYALLLLVNLLTGIVFRFDGSGRYVHGPLYPLVFLFPLGFILSGVLTSLRHKKAFSKKQFVSNLVFSGFFVGASILQAAVLPTVLLTCFSGSVALMIVFFTLETPDYQNLLKAMDELKRSKEETEFAEAEAIAANQAKSNFLANMSHEIRTPINGIIGMNTLIIEESSEPVIREYALNMQSAANSLLAIINDILDFSRIESGKMNLVLTDYQVCSLLNDCYNLICMRAEEKGLTLEFENDPDMPGVLCGDEVRVRQIVMNLLTNAVKYTKKGGVTLRAGYRMVREDEMMLCVAVEDTGIGIGEEGRERLFEAFERLDENMNRNIEGTGLGLKITKQLLEMMSGDIRVESERQKGSVFTVTIPQKVVSKEPAGLFVPRYTEGTRPSYGNPYEFIAPDARILVVDDVEMNLKVIKGLLKKTGIRIETALSGAACLEKAQEKSYDLILLDHMMPEMDGVMTLKRLGGLEKNKNKKTPVIMLTANVTSGAKEGYLKEGFADYLAKPVLERQLYKLMLKFLPEKLVKRGVSLEAGAKEKKQENVPKQEHVRKAAKTGDALLDRLTFLDVQLGLSYCADDAEFYREMLSSYLENVKQGQLQEAYDAEDWENYAILVHGVKSNSLTIGASKLSAEAKALEHAAKDGNVTYIEQKHGGFMEAYRSLADALSAAIKE